MNPWHESFELLKSIEDSNDLDKSVIKWLKNLGTAAGRKLGIGAEKKATKEIGETAASRAQDVDKLTKLRDANRSKRGRLTDISERVGKLEGAKSKLDLPGYRQLKQSDELASGMGKTGTSAIKEALSRGTVNISKQEIAANRIRRAADKEIQRADDAMASGKLSPAIRAFLKKLGMRVPEPARTTGIQRAVPVKMSLEKKPKQSKEFLEFIKQIGIQKRN